MPFEPTTSITLPRATWYTAYRKATEEASDMAWQKEWVGTGLRQDYLSMARFTKGVLDSAPRTAETITADVPYRVWSMLEGDGFVSSDTEPDLSHLR